MATKKNDKDLQQTIMEAFEKECEAGNYSEDEIKSARKILGKTLKERVSKLSYCSPYCGWK